MMLQGQMHTPNACVKVIPGVLVQQLSVTVSGNTRTNSHSKEIVSVKDLLGAMDYLMGA